MGSKNEVVDWNWGIVDCLAVALPSLLAASDAGSTGSQQKHGSMDAPKCTDAQAHRKRQEEQDRTEQTGHVGRSREGGEERKSRRG